MIPVVVAFIRWRCSRIHCDVKKVSLENASGPCGAPKCVKKSQGHRLKVVYSNPGAGSTCYRLVPYSFMLVAHARRTCIRLTTPVVNVIMLAANYTRDYVLYGLLRAHNDAVNSD